MTQIADVIRLETDLLHDSIWTLSRIHEALHSRHGERFRNLERRIEGLADAPAPDIEVERLEPFCFIAIPPPEWAEAIADAKALGVI